MLEHMQAKGSCVETSMSWREPRMVLWRSRGWLRYARSSRYAKRLEELRLAAVEEEICIHESSIADFRHFVERCPFSVKRASLFLLGDGTVCAEWAHNSQEVSLQFLGSGRVQCAVLDVSGEMPKTTEYRTSIGITHSYDILTRCNAWPTIRV